MSRPIREAMCVIGGLLYLSCPRCCGHAHRLPAAPGAVDQTVRTAIEGEKPLRCKERRGRRSQMHSRTRLTLDAVGTPTGCRLRREPWIRLSGRPSRGGGHCGVRGQGRGKITDALSYRSYPRCRGHAHRLPASPGAVDQTVRTAIEGRRSLRCKERMGEKVTGGLLYRSCPRCRPWPSPTA